VLKLGCVALKRISGFARGRTLARERRVMFARRTGRLVAALSGMVFGVTERERAAARVEMRGCIGCCVDTTL
jgi:hypothetical protein